MVSLKSAARFLGKGPRQVRRYVESGELFATGGGHGVPYLFAMKDLEAFARRTGAKTYAPRETWKGLIDGDTLSRIAHAAVVRHENPGKYLHYLEGFFCLWSLPAKTVQGVFRNGLPPIAAVPDATRQWGLRLASKLSPLEMDYVGAMFAVRFNPTAKMEAVEAKSLGVAMDIVKRTRPYLFYNEKTFQQTPEAWAAIADSVRSKFRAEYPAQFAAEMFKHTRETFFGQDRARAWQIYGDHHPLMHGPGRLLYAAHAGDVDGLRAFIVSDPDDEHLPEFPEADELRNSLTGLAKKLRNLRRRPDRNPSVNRVGQALGLKYRAQGCRVARQLRDKLRGRPEDLQLLFEEYLRCDHPKAWGASREAPRLRQLVSRCVACRSTIEEKDLELDTCPECGRLLVLENYRAPGKQRDTLSLNSPSLSASRATGRGLGRLLHF